ncbi:hypothetical protein GALL_102990 [mine drainage metagenome]|uniref:Cupin type-2 domain-containing protein n=1 Tax=mine drainage metagenome TaxID=410659 RepID=A0A1J5T1B9_9ZZZZ
MILFKKVSLLIFLSILVLITKAQSDSLRSGVYDIESIEGKKLQGKTSTVAVLNMHASTLEPGKTNHPPRALMDREELVIVKEGSLTLTINGNNKTLSAGGIALIVAGDEQSFENASDKRVSYYVIGFKSLSPVDINRGKMNGGSLLKDWNELVVKKTDKGESRPVFDRASSMFERFEVHATTLNAGQQSHQPHMHNQEEIMLLMGGNVTMHIGKNNFNAVAGNIIFLTPGIVHNLTNTGKEPCWYYAIKWYQDTEAK